MFDTRQKFALYVDDFLEPNQLIDIQQMINTVSFAEKRNGNGLFSYRYQFSSDSEYKLPHKESIISKIESLGIVNRDTHVFDEIYLDARENKEKLLIHKDSSHINFILYLYGDITLTNGTGFWYNDGNGAETLTTHIGFVPNRAVIFNGYSMPHSDLQSFGGSSLRFSLSMFICEK